MILVSIPGKDRGVGFARQMILMLQQGLEKLLLSRGTSFDFFYMLDDDLQDVRVYDRSILQKRQCSLSFAMEKMEAVLLDEIKRADRRLSYLKLLEDNTNLSNDDYIQKKELQKMLESFLMSYFESSPSKDKEIDKFTIEFKRSIEDIVKASDQPRSLFIENNSDNFSVNILQKADRVHIKKLQEFKEKLWDQLATIKAESAFQIPMVSLEKRHIAEINDYCIIAPSCTHRFSIQNHGFVLFQAAAVKGFGYLASSEPTSTEERLYTMTIPALKEKCKEYHIRGYSRLSKSLLVEKLSQFIEAKGIHEMLIPQEGIIFL